MEENLLEEYILQHSSEEHEYLHRLYRATQTHLLRPRMASGHLQGLMLKLLAQLVNPSLVLEIGTYSGYSALSMASGMKKGSRIITYEINDEQEDFTRHWFDHSPFPPTIEMRIGDVLRLLPEDKNLKPETVDMVFIDANKRDYTAYYNLIFPYVRSGGLIIADNTLWDSHVIDPDYDNDAQTKGIRSFNDLVRSDQRAEKFILPLRDGLTIVRKK